MWIFASSNNVAKNLRKVLKCLPNVLEKILEMVLTFLPLVDHSIEMVLTNGVDILW